MKVPPRQSQHPEVMVTGEMSGPVIKLLKEVVGGSPEGLRSSGQMQMLMDSIGGSVVGDTAYASLMYAILRWEESGRPVYFLEEELARVLATTDLPFTRLELPVWLPDDGMWVTVPKGLFNIENTVTGLHRVEGFYLVYDDVAVPLTSDGRPDLDSRVNFTGISRVVEVVPGRNRMLRCLTCVGIGEARPRPNAPPEMRDDAVVVFHLVTGMELGLAATALGGLHELERLIVNLLYAMSRTTSVVRESQECELPKKAAKRRPERADKLLARAGKTVAPYTVLRLSNRTRSARSAPRGDEAEAVRRLQHPKLVPGHFHRYWVLRPEEGERVLAVKQGVGGTLHLVEYLLAPYQQGVDLPPKQNKTVVIK